MTGTFATEKRFYKVSYIKNKSNVKDKNSHTVQIYTLIRPSTPILQHIV
jgi:hypothetical protein